ncbi:MAG TPA: Coq4 family protein [Polyangiaceae bacterium]|nr:Coq4 family protein [Polyangiaceae bacterium]
MSSSLPLPRFDVLRGGAALAALVRDPSDLPKVFVVVDSLSGTAPHRLWLAFRRSDAGARLLRDRPEVVSLLLDRERLRRLPEGSLGRAYLDFVESEGISAESFAAAYEEAKAVGFGASEMEYVVSRVRDSHDLFHALTGYKGDILGELALLAFALGQHWNTGIAVIVLAALLKGVAPGAAKLVLDGYRRGRAAEWLPALEWESLLATPVDELRARLRVGAPPEYRPLRGAPGQVGE